MPTASHTERHFTGSEIVRDVVIGMSDGLTVPFALAAGLSGAVSSSGLLLVAGLAEVAAGSIAMGLGGFLAARSDVEMYRNELAREQSEVRTVPEREMQEVREIFTGYGLQGEALEQATRAVTSNAGSWVRFMMREELGLEEPHPARALHSALTIGGAYILGGLVPLVPYAFGLPVSRALLISVATTSVALAAFGAVKGYFTGVGLVRSASQTTLVGGLAAGAAHLIARLVSAALGSP